MADETDIPLAENQNLPDGAEPIKEPVRNTSEQTETETPVAALNEDELAEAKKDGAKEAVKESATVAPDAELLGNPDAQTTAWLGHDDIQPWAFWLDRSVDDIKAAYEGGGIPTVKLYGLLALERNGQNRTNYVKYMMEALDLDSAELPGGGPSWTNDQTNISDL